MKKLEEIIKQDPIFLNDWSNKKEVFNDFNEEKYDYESDSYIIKNPIDEDINILFASYGNANYSGDAWVMFEKEGKLFEVSGGHCSCYGLEGQWEEDEILLEEIENRLVNGTFGEDDYSDNNFKEELCKFLGIEFKRNLD
jgi:hypothetical protein